MVSSGGQPNRSAWLYLEEQLQGIGCNMYHTAEREGVPITPVHAFCFPFPQVKPSQPFLTLGIVIHYCFPRLQDAGS